MLGALKRLVGIIWIKKKKNLQFYNSKNIFLAVFFFFSVWFYPLKLFKNKNPPKHDSFKQTVH